MGTQTQTALPLTKHITVKSQQEGLERAAELLTNGFSCKSSEGNDEIMPLNEVSFTDETTGERYRLEKVEHNFHYPKNEIRRYNGYRLIGLPSIPTSPKKKKWQ